MTITTSVLVPDGIVLAADSRQIVQSPGGQWRVDSDNANKIFRLSSHLAVSVYGQGHFYLSRDESPRNFGMIVQSAARQFPSGYTVFKAATALHQSILKEVEKHRDVTNTKRLNVAFHVAGYNAGSSVGELYHCQVPGSVALERQTSDAGMVWSGQREIINRLIMGYDPRLFEFVSLRESQEKASGHPKKRPRAKTRGGFLANVKRLLGGSSGRRSFLPGGAGTASSSANISAESVNRSELQKMQLYFNFQTMPLQEAVTLAAFLIRATVLLQQLSDGIIGSPGQFPACGGPIDVAVLTAEQGFCWLQHKQLQVRAESDFCMS